MAWKTRNGRRYYYQSVREGGIHRTKYVGCGAAGQCAAQENANWRQKRLQANQQLGTIRQEHQDIAAVADGTRTWGTLLLHASLIILGYYCSNRTWRERKRYAREKTKTRTAA